MVGLTSFPLELLVLLNQHIDSLQDRYELCLVNRLLYDVFRDYLFYDVRMDTTDQVIGVCRRLAREPHLFYKIQHFSINVPFVPYCPYSTLLRYCPNLTRLTLGKQFWLPATSENNDWEEMMVDLDEYADMPCLRTLTVDCNRNYGVDDLFPLLLKCPQLEELRLNRLLWFTMPADMERIHLQCPRLTLVQLDHKHIIPNLTDFLPPIIQVDSGPCLTMRTFDFFHNGLWDDFVPWLDYIAKKYPFLTTLTLRTIPTWTNSLRQADTVHVGQVQLAVRNLVNACAWIRSAHFSHIWWAKDFFRARINQDDEVVGLNNVTLVSHSPLDTTTWWTTPDKTFHLLSVAATRLQDLTVSMHPRPYFKPLRLASHLVRLTLVAQPQNSIPVDPRFFLWLCPSLRYFSIEGAQIVLEHQQQQPFVTTRSITTASMPRSHLLYQLVLKECTFTNNVIDSIAQYCPALHHLVLTACVLQDCYFLKIHFPLHQMRFIQLNQVRIKIPDEMNPPRPIEFITITRHHPTPRMINGSKRGLDSSGLISQTFKVLHMHYHQAQSGNELDPNFLPLEYITRIKCLSARELDYYQSKAGLPGMTTVDDSVAAKRQRRSLMDHELNRQVVVLEKPPVSNFGGHLVVCNYDLHELQVNGKWIVL